MAGVVTAIVRDARTGRFVRVRHMRNKINNNALSALVQWGVGVATNFGSGAPLVPYPIQMQLGTGTGVPALTDTGLFTPAANTEVNITSFSVYQVFTMQFVAFWGTSTPANNYTEAALFDVNGVCWAHVLLQTSANQPYIAIQSGQTLTIIWKITLTGN